ncbi:hypothetical protein [Sphingobacterium sp. MYb382]|uniref:hypothetical protein n=1 Tax=Sphingobacterium sp. MYb382 TaxID=2745278 RepID=UPI0030AB84D7
MHINRTFVLVHPDALGTMTAINDDAIASYDRFILVDDDVDTLNDLAMRLESQEKDVVILDKCEDILPLLSTFDQAERQRVVLEVYPHH